MILKRGIDKAVEAARIAELSRCGFSSGRRSPGVGGDGRRVQDIDYFGFPLSRLTETSVITTLHGRLDLPELQDVYGEFPEVPLISISEAQRRSLRHATWLSTIYNGIDLRHFAIARAVGMPLRLAAKIGPVDEEYFTGKIQLRSGIHLLSLWERLAKRRRKRFWGTRVRISFPSTGLSHSGLR
jgi:hypothetical protein